MAILDRLVRTSRLWRSISSPKTLTPSACSRRITRPSTNRSAFSSEVFSSRGLPHAAEPYSLFPLVLAGIFGVGVLEMAYADANESADEGRKEPAKTEPSSSSAFPSSHEDLEGIAKKLRSQIMLKLVNRGLSAASHPEFTVSVKGQKVSTKFQIPPACEVSHLLANLVSQLGVKTEENGGGSDMLIRAWDRFSCSFPRMLMRVNGLVSNLESGREIEDTILLALQRPEVYDDIARRTRHKYETTRPRAVLFEGPPGTGKTSCARVIASQAGVPLLYVPLEVVMSKYYGESEHLLGKVFALANELPKGALIFLDEIDSFAAARDGEMHEATRRILSVLLRQIDGFEQDKRVIVIGATNRKQDLDPALISRFDTMITFDLPDHDNRKEIAAKYAKHLTEPELDELARVTEGMSGRDIRDVCLQAERSWASKIIRGKVSKDGDETCLPPLQEYMDSGSNRRKALLSAATNQQFRSSSPIGKRSQLDMI
ncbi:fidgetin-like protein 1 [Neltuma alba]|uniref:fidgetin-like protein 1 n=1 Tax=Neltuma alba TaxID=207710 RepID=UPI0010A46228|nr:fidgetin-like protein 1 [Prosopis alba]